MKDGYGRVTEFSQRHKWHLTVATEEYEYGGTKYTVYYRKEGEQGMGTTKLFSTKSEAISYWVKNIVGDDCEYVFK